MYYYQLSTGQPVAYDEASSAPSGATQITAEQYAQISIAPTAFQIQHALISSAQKALDATDMVAFRCFKAGVVYPTAWQTYTTALRNIVNGTDTTSTVLPTAPSYPAGT